MPGSTVASEHTLTRLAVLTCSPRRVHRSAAHRQLRHRTARRRCSALLGAGDEAARNVMLAVRLPRLLAAFGVGGLLALAGVLLQALFRNPLADP